MTEGPSGYERWKETGSRPLRIADCGLVGPLDGLEDGVLHVRVILPTMQFRYMRILVESLYQLKIFNCLKTSQKLTIFKILV